MTTPREVAVKQSGMSLIELLIAVAIVGILSALAIASYGMYTKSANRTDATKTMTLDAQALERCYSQNFTYATCATVPALATSSQGFYRIVVATATSSFTITATPIKAPQTGDKTCAQFTLNSAGTQGATNSAAANTTSTCWGSS
jgi:type IV pilus assembly protein PilE